MQPETLPMSLDGSVSSPRTSGRCDNIRRNKDERETRDSTIPFSMIFGLAVVGSSCLHLIDPSTVCLGETRTGLTPDACLASRRSSHVIISSFPAALRQHSYLLIRLAATSAVFTELMPTCLSAHRSKSESSSCTASRPRRDLRTSVGTPLHPLSRPPPSYFPLGFRPFHFTPSHCPPARPLLGLLFSGVSVGPRSGPAGRLNHARTAVLTPVSDRRFRRRV